MNARAKFDKRPPSGYENCVRLVNSAQTALCLGHRSRKFRKSPVTNQRSQFPSGCLLTLHTITEACPYGVTDVVYMSRLYGDPHGLFLVFCKVCKISDVFHPGGNLGKNTKRKTKRSRIWHTVWWLHITSNSHVCL